MFGSDVIVKEVIVKENDWDVVNKMSHGDITIVKDPNLFGPYLNVSSSSLYHINLKK